MDDRIKVSDLAGLTLFPHSRFDDLPPWSMMKTRRDLTENSELQCSECEAWSGVDKWPDHEVGCDLCGEHSATACPECDRTFDLIYNPWFEERKRDEVADADTA